MKLADCTLVSLNNVSPNSLENFDCGNSDLNEFFKKDSKLYSEQLLGKTYFFENELGEIVAGFTVSNDSIKTKLLPKSSTNKVSRKIPNPKRTKSYPAVLIGRLGVSEKFKGLSLGFQILSFLKGWFADSSNKTGCRFIVVDAYNETIPLSFYQKSNFKFLFKDDTLEKEFNGVDIDDTLRTRLLVFDLMSITA